MTPEQVREQAAKALEDCLVLIKDMARFVGKMSLQDYRLFNEAPINAKTALAAIRSMQLPDLPGGDVPDGWQPMETAPKDGTWILGCEEDQQGKYPPQVIMRWRSAAGHYDEGWYTDSGHGRQGCIPIGWQSLPAAAPLPASTSSEKGGG